MVRKKMSKKSWLETLHTILSKQRTHGHDPRLAIVGIGHELCGDDALGVVISQKLETILQGIDSVRVFAAGSAPENLCGALRRFTPDLLILIDAAHLSEKPGTIRWLELEKIDGISASTHTIPLRILTDYLTAEIGCRVVLLGVQPAALTYGPLSRAVEESIQTIVQGFIDAFQLEVSHS
jgi:hydrogenase 3 maturation protease